MHMCRLCGGNDIAIIHKGTRDRQDIDVLRCNACGLVFLSEIATDEQFYSESQMRREINFEQWRKNTLPDDERRFLRFQECIRDKDILDFGCGNGGFLKLARVHGSASRAIGVELDMECVQRLTAEGIECYGDISALPNIEFDVVFLFHVIEHLPEPEESLGELLTHIKEGGLLIMETPNADDALLSIYGCEKFADFTYWSPHIYLYNESTMAGMLRRVERCGTVEILQEQRYPLANHLQWLAKGVPGGGVKELVDWNRPQINQLYAEILREKKACDTLICLVRRA